MNEFPDFIPEYRKDYEEQMEYDTSLQDQAQRVHELEELLEIAEASAGNIDRLLDSVDQSRSKFWSLTAGASLLLSVMGVLLAFFYANTLRAEYLLNYSYVFGSFFFFLIFVSYLMGARKHISHISRLKRDLSVEVDIHHRLISMIDQQLQRVSHGGYYSPVHRAIIDIRVRRMMRG